MALSLLIEASIFRSQSASQLEHFIETFMVLGSSSSVGELRSAVSFQRLEGSF